MFSFFNDLVCHAVDMTDKPKVQTLDTSHFSAAAAKALNFYEYFHGFVLGVHALFKSTLCSSPRFFRVHALFESTLVAVHAHSHCFKNLGPKAYDRLLSVQAWFSVHARSPSVLVLVSFRFCSNTFF